VFLSSLPLTPNGKVDRKALPVPEGVQAESGTEHVPPRNALEERLVGLWEEFLDLRPIGVTDDFFLDLGVPSVVAAQLFARIEKEFGQRLPVSPVFQAPTIERLAALLTSGGSADARRFSSLVAIQPNGSRPPVYCVHGGAGTILDFAAIARHLGEDQPFYGLQARGLYGRDAPLNRVADMAAHYVAEIKEAQPRGPYLLAGYCFGGLIAYEMAQQIEAAGGGVGWLGLVNSPTPAYIRVHGGEARPITAPPIAAPVGESPAGAAAPADIPRRAPATPTPPVRPAPAAKAGPRERLLRVARRLRSLPPRDALAEAAEVVLRLAHRRAPERTLQLCELSRRPVPESLRDQYFRRITAREERAYTPRPYDGPLVIYKAEGIYHDANLGWGEVLPDSFFVVR
jgi:acyl carrier protein